MSQYQKLNDYSHKLKSTSALLLTPCINPINILDEVQAR